MSVFSAMNINASGLTAERFRMDIISGNIANQNTTMTESGEAYRRKIAVFNEYVSEATGSASGVKAVEVVEDQSELTPVYDPSHPHADETGYYYMPNVDVTVEMIDLMVATRAYESNVSAIDASKSMLMSALEIGR